MPQYLSPGVYVEEIPSAVQAIAGVGTSTAGFIGLVPDEVTIPLGALPSNNKIVDLSIDPTTSTDGGTTFNLKEYPVDSAANMFSFVVNDSAGKTVPLDSVKLVNDHSQAVSKVVVTPPVKSDAKITASYRVLSTQVKDEVAGFGDAKKTKFRLSNYPVITVPGKYTVTITPADGTDFKTNAVAIVNDETIRSSVITVDPAPPLKAVVKVSYERLLAAFVQPDSSGKAKLCTNFSEFRRTFGDFSTDIGQRTLAHAVHGFFYNGGTRCFVAGVKQETEIAKALENFAAVDEIALVAAPGMTDANIRDQIVTHCKISTQDRFALLDSKQVIDDDLTEANIAPPPNSDYAAFYFPWLKVFDPATKNQDPNSDGLISVPPSGHMAGIYARVDINRGVHKAPANEPVMGALGLEYQISKAQQDGLNPEGINCIRELNGNIRVWGARTVGGDANGEWRYINVRRTMLYLRESIDEGTQWAVFEPNDQNLWAKISRNVSAFLTNVWRTGALFGSTAAEAFYVKCDAETNPPELRELGQVVTEIGVAIVRPAEFVIFRISQWQPQKS